MAPPPDFTVQLPVYEGPLDLLLQLIEKRELDITRVSLAAVTDEYLAHLRSLEVVDPARVADFLTVAARLLLIKSRLLLPQERQELEGADDSEDDGEALARALEEYRQFKAVARLLAEYENQGQRAYLREAPPPTFEKRLDPGGLPPDALLKALRRVLAQQARTPEPVDAVVRPLRVTVRQRFVELTARLRAGKPLAFHDVLGAAPTRQEVIATFLALLELVKVGRARVVQPALFAPILVEPVMETLRQVPEDEGEAGPGDVDEDV